MRLYKLYNCPNSFLAEGKYLTLFKSKLLIFKEFLVSDRTRIETFNNINANSRIQIFVALDIGNMGNLSSKPYGWK